jgi:hypothetical protein
LQDKEVCVSPRRIFAVLAFPFLSGLSAWAADPGVQRGIDAFVTPADGRTYYDFSQSPIPAGFFCAGSPAFSGRVAFKGLPLATQAPGQLRSADTVIERLDDAVFDAKGTAVTRIQFRALSLVSIQPISSSCGSFYVYVSLAGPQRVTAMSIHRTEEGGGSFVAPLAVDARLSFISVKPVKSTRKLELAGKFTFPAAQPLPWRFRSAAAAKGTRFATVDTNGDLRPDTPLSLTSNFSPGLAPDRLTDSSLIGACPCEPTCHSTSGHQHCYLQTDNCYPVVCGI